MVAHSAHAGQFVRVLASNDGELIPLTLADWDAKAGTIDLVIQGMGTSSPAHEPHGGWRHLRRHRRPARTAERPAKPARRMRRSCSPPAASDCLPIYPDRPGASQDRQPRHADCRLPLREPPVLDRQGRTPRQAAGRIRRPTRRHLHLQRRHLRPEGLRHHAAGGHAQGGRRLQGAQDRRGHRRRSADDDAGGQRPHQALRRADRRQPQLDHGGCHRHVRRLHGAGDWRRARPSACMPASTGRSSTPIPSNGTSTCRVSASSRRRRSTAASFTVSPDALELSCLFGRGFWGNPGRN